MLHHLRRNISDPKTTILFVGFQAENTLGRKLLQGDKVARIYGEEYEVRAKGLRRLMATALMRIEGELLDFIVAIPNKPKRVFVVHGEPDAANAMAAGLSKLGIENVIVPEGGDRFEL